MKLLLSFLGLGIFATSSQAAIIYSGTQNIPIPFTFDGVYINPLTFANTTSEPVDYDTSPWVNLSFSGVDVSNGDLLTPVVLPGSVVSNVSLLTLVDGGSTFATGGSASSTHMGAGAMQFQAGVPGYIGFSFKPTSAAPTQYGWAQVTLQDNGTSGSVNHWAIESTPGTGISVGAVPEPTSALLVLASTAMVLSRRRQQPMINK